LKATVRRIEARRQLGFAVGAAWLLGAARDHGVGFRGGNDRFE
jgi:hypothetical protein